VLPQSEPWAGRECFIVPSVCSRDIVCAERSNIGSFEQLLQLLDVINDALNIHA